MSAQDSNKLSKALTRLVNHFSDKYDITYAETVGILQMKIMDLFSQAMEEEEDEDV